MIRSISFILLCFILCFSTVYSQNTGKRSQVIKSSEKKTINVSNAIKNLPPKVYNIEAPEPGSSNYRNNLQQIKQQLNQQYPKQKASNKNMNRLNAEKPAIMASFEGNLYESPAMSSGAPNDNTMAISNNGKLISGINRSLYFFDVNEDTMPVDKISLEEFTDPLDITDIKYDPKLLYDPNEDKFILVCLAGRDDQSTYIIVGFSQTNDPTEGWNLYSLPGNPKNDTSWSDFPAVGLSEGELFITINLLRNNNLNTPDAWKFLFKESLIWQIDKFSGFEGESTLNMVYHDSVFYNGSSIRNLTPVQSGSGLTGPNMYFLSNRNFDIENDSIFIIEVNNALDNINTPVNVNVSLADIPYGLPPNARQPQGHYFDVNDSRILGAFIENGLIQYVQNTRDPETNFPGIYHGVISDLEDKRTIKGHVINDPDTMVDFGFPNIAYVGNGGDQNHAVIAFDHSGINSDSSGFAGISAIFYRNDNIESAYSERQIIKAGDTLVNVVIAPPPLGAEYERWGDYFGLQRKYNEPGQAWMSGFYGRDFSPNGNVHLSRNGTWIAGVQAPDIEYLQLPENRKILLYPNPGSIRMYSVIDVPKDGILQVSLFDEYGKLVTTLIDQSVVAGEKEFSFPTSSFGSGLYILDFRLNGVQIYTEEIVIMQ